MAGTQNQPLEYEQVTYNAPDGAQICKTTTDKMAFYGTTPVAKYGDLGAASTYIATSNTTSTVGLTTLVDMQALVAQVSTLTQCLKSYGLG